MERRRLGEVEEVEIERHDSMLRGCFYPGGWFRVNGVEVHPQDAGKALWDAADPAREARIKAEALREAADAAWHNEEVSDFDSWMDWLRDRAKRLEESDV